MSIKVRATVTSVSIVDNPWGEKLIKIEMSEEREVPGPVVVQKGGGELAREIAPVITQVLRSLPGFTGGRVKIPRLILYLYEDEWDKMFEKPNIGDTVEICFTKDRIDVRKEK